jgi:hypothetical protein
MKKGGEERGRGGEGKRGGEEKWKKGKKVKKKNILHRKQSKIKKPKIYHRLKKDQTQKSLTQKLKERFKTPKWSPAVGGRAYLQGKLIFLLQRKRVSPYGRKGEH